MITANTLKQRRDRERARVVVFVVENFDVERERVGLAADVSGDDRDRAELSQRARGAEHHAVEQAPFDIGQSDAEEHLPGAGAQHHGGFFFFRPLRFHQRNQFARDERERHEGGGQDDSGDGEDDVDVVVA